MRKAPLQRTRGSEHGVAAIEFALIFPLLLVMFFAIVNLSQYISVNRKLTVTANLVADLVTRKKDVTQADLNDVFIAAQLSLRPLDAGNVRVDVHRLKKVGTGLDWKKSSTGGTACSVPTKANYTTLLNATDLIVVVVCMPSFDEPVDTNTTSIVGNFFLRLAPPRQEVAMRPRLGTTLKFCNTATPPVCS